MRMEARFSPTLPKKMESEKADGKSKRMTITLDLMATEHHFLKAYRSQKTPLQTERCTRVGSFEWSWFVALGRNPTLPSFVGKFENLRPKAWDAKNSWKCCSRALNSDISNLRPCKWRQWGDNCRQSLFKSFIKERKLKKVNVIWNSLKKFCCFFIKCKVGSGPWSIQVLLQICKLLFFVTHVLIYMCIKLSFS